MIVQNLQQRCIELSGVNTTAEDQHPFYKFFWTKWVTAVDREKDSGFAFTGDFFANETLELDPTTRLILFAAATGRGGYFTRSGGKRDYKYIYEHHEVFLLLPDGTLERTGLVTFDDKRWAISIRDQVALLADRIKQAYGSATPLQIAIDHLSQRALAVKLGNPVAWTQADLDMLLVLLDAVEKHAKPADAAPPVEPEPPAPQPPITPSPPPEAPTERIPAKQVAIWIRQKLKEQWGKTIDFAVRTRKTVSGPDIHITWINGPTREQVQEVVGHLHGAKLDKRRKWLFRPILLDGKMVQLENTCILYNHTVSKDQATPDQCNT